MVMSEQWRFTCQMCGLALVAPAEVCPRCGTPVLLAGLADTPGESSVPPSLTIDELGRSALGGLAASEQLTERPLNVMLALTAETSEVEQWLSQADEPVPVEMRAQLPMQIAQAGVDVSLVSDDALGLAASQDDGAEIPDTLLPQEGKRVNRLARWFSARIIAVLALAQALLFALLFITARSETAAGVIAPDWGLASLRIGVAAAVVGGPLLIFCLIAWRLQRWPASLYGGCFALLLVLVGGAGVLSAAPLHRLQGRWYEGQGQYGLALAAYQFSGDALATSQDMARISIEWARQLSAQHDYSDAITQLEMVVLNYKADSTAGSQARLALIQDYLAWGDQAQQQQAFSDALAHYQTLQKANYCTDACQTQAHAHAAQAFLEWAQQLAARQQYDAAIVAYQQLVQSYSDTLEGQEAEQALTAAQPVMGHLVYEDKTPAAHFQVLLASQWTFATATQAFTLLGLQYTAQTDTSGLFMIPAVMVGNTYLIAWMDPSGHAGTCKTTNNQPLYVVRVPPLRAADAGAVDVDCV